MTLFDLDDRYVDDAGVGSAISRREGVLVSLAAHALFVVAALWLPETAWFQAFAAPVPAAVVPVQPNERSAPFMLVEAAPAPAPPKQPRVVSDMDRRAQSRERAPQPTNDQPFSRGNTADFVDGNPAPPTTGPAPSPSPAPSPPAPPQPNAAAIPNPVQQPRPPDTREAGSGIGASLRNMDQMIRRERFDNQQGGLDYDPNAPAISFDSKGVDFGPWMARFVARVKRNWLVPYAAQTMSGRVVITFWVHRDGRITDIQVLRPSGVSSFNTAAFQALVQSNPTLPLPAEYPDDKMQITATFFYNERPPR